MEHLCINIHKDLQYATIPDQEATMSSHIKDKNNQNFAYDIFKFIFLKENVC